MIIVCVTGAKKGEGGGGEEKCLLPSTRISDLFGATHFNRSAVSEKYGSTGFNNLICHNQRG